VLPRMLETLHFDNFNRVKTESKNKFGAVFSAFELENDNEKSAKKSTKKSCFLTECLPNECQTKLISN
jgi:hypothetical protein